MVRPAKFTDIPEIMGLLRKCHAKSKYSHADIDEPTAKALLMTAIQSHVDVPTIGQTPVFVSGKDEVTGVIVGCLQPVHFAVMVPMVSDIMWYIDGNTAGPRDGIDLLSALHDWADRFPAPVKRFHIATDAVMDPDVLGRMLKHQGFKVTGYVFEKEAE